MSKCSLSGSKTSLQDKRGNLGFQALHIRYNYSHVPNSITDPRIFCAFVAFSMAFLKVPEVLGQTPAASSAAAKPVKLTEMPERFFQIQDSSGFFWQAHGNGALVSGDVQYLQSGLNLIVGESAFAPIEAFVREPGNGGEKVDVRLIENRSTIVITRDLWFDTRRSAVRVFDSLTNISTTPLTVPVALRTTYPFAWQSLHGSGGGLLSNDPTLRLGARDYSIGIHFSPTEGRHDTLLVVGSEKGGQKPELKASANSRELTFLYTLVIPPGESRSLLHWIMQRNLSGVSDDQTATSPFLQGDKLIVPEVEAKWFASVVNFAPSAFQVESTAPAQIKSLVSLNDLTDRIGFHRRSEDMLWISPNNQISGIVDREGIITISTIFTGDQDVKISEIAAISGGSGSGRNPLVFLRDGRVLAGPIRKGEIKWSAGGGQMAAASPEIINALDLNLLLFATGPADGVAPAKTTHFLRLIDGTVLALVNGPAAELEWIAPWGREKWRWSDLIEALVVSVPSPRFRVIHKNGSEVSAFLPVGNWVVNTPYAQGIEIPTSAIDRIWVAGGARPDRATETVDWRDFAEVPFGQGPVKGFLLLGSQLLEGSFSDAHFELLAGGNLLRLETAQIAAIRRSVDPESEDLIEVELANGEKLTGQFASPYMKITGTGGEIQIPSSRLLAYRNAAR